VLNPASVVRTRLELGQRYETAGGLTIEGYAVPGKIALYLEQDGPGFGTREGDTIGLHVSTPASGASFHYIPGCAGVDAALAHRLADARLVLFDGTLYSDGEMIAQGLSEKTGARMGHMSMSGPHGSMAAFATLGVARRVYVHMNNSNPVLREGSPERGEVERAGWEIARDGMELRL
jgi:pyrroloquinoline quinone biosynthesis protein B